MSYKSTVRSCYLGTVCQAVIVNLTALLFTAFGEQFGLSFTQLGVLVLLNFFTQVFVALIFGSVVDRVGFRPFIVGAHLAAAAGLTWIAVTPWVPVPPYVMLVLGTLIIGAAGGFFELLLSPIVNAIPTDEKSSAMAIMHAFFCFGHVGVAFGTTLFLFVFGREAWPVVVGLWVILPLLNALLFARCPMASAVPVVQQSSARDALRKPVFTVLVLMIVLAGASELTFSQWASAFMEQAMGLPKVLGDIAGVGMFAVMMGVGRIAYGVLRQKNVAWLPSQSRLMLMGSALAAVSYVIVAVTYNPFLGLLACALCGLGVSLLWPGTLSLAVDAFPRAGTWMFAVMAAGGNIGAAGGPAVFGIIADYGGLRMGYMLTTVIPVLSVIILVLFIRMSRRTA